jgi:hypothetical protein
VGVYDVGASSNAVQQGCDQNAQLYTHGVPAATSACPSHGARLWTFCSLPPAPPVTRLVRATAPQLPPWSWNWNGTAYANASTAGCYWEVVATVPCHEPRTGGATGASTAGPAALPFYFTPADGNGVGRGRLACAAAAWLPLSLYAAGPSGCVSNATRGWAVCPLATLRIARSERNFGGGGGSGGVSAFSAALDSRRASAPASAGCYSHAVMAYPRLDGDGSALAECAAAPAMSVLLRCLLLRPPPPQPQPPGMQVVYSLVNSQTDLCAVSVVLTALLTCVSTAPAPMLAFTYPPLMAADAFGSIALNNSLTQQHCPDVTVTAAACNCPTDAFVLGGANDTFCRCLPCGPSMYQPSPNRAGTSRAATPRAMFTAVACV